MPSELDVFVLSEICEKVRSSRNIYELLDSVYELCVRDPTGENTNKVLQFVRELFPPDIYGDALILLQQRQQLRGVYEDYLPGDLTTHIVCTPDRLASVAASLKYKRRFCLFLQFDHPCDKFPRANYLPEYVTHYPYLNRGKMGSSLNFSSAYCRTEYLDRISRENYRVFLTKEGLICRLNNINGVIKLQPITVTSGQTLFVMSPQGWLFVAEKSPTMHHTSFLRGGPVIFAGYCKVDNGILQEVRCESGHFSPPISSLQNLAYFLVSRGYRPASLERTRFLYVNRILKKTICDGQEKTYLSSDIEEVPLAALLSRSVMERGIYNSRQEQTGEVHLCLRNTELLSSFFPRVNNTQVCQYAELDPDQPKTSQLAHDS